MKILSSLNKSLVYLLAASTILGFNSCSSVMKCDIYGKTGTKIYQTNGDWIGTIDNSGKAQIKLSRKKKYDFFYAQESEGSPIIPIGLNYNKRSNQEFLGGLLSIICLPVTVGISVYKCEQYFTQNEDVKDQLKLLKRQNSNTDLSKLIYNSSDPIEEIKALPPKQHKKGKQEKQVKGINHKNFEIPWINKDGCITKVLACYVGDELGSKSKKYKMNIGEDFKIAFSHFEKDESDVGKDDGEKDVFSILSFSNPTINFSGTLEGSPDFDFTIELKNIFKDDGKNGYMTRINENDSIVLISRESSSHAGIFFHLDNETNITFIFDVNSFEEEENTITRYDVLNMFQNLLHSL